MRHNNHKIAHYSQREEDFDSGLDAAQWDLMAFLVLFFVQWFSGGLA